MRKVSATSQMLNHKMIKLVTANLCWIGVPCCRHADIYYRFDDLGQLIPAKKALAVGLRVHTCTQESDSAELFEKEASDWLTGAVMQPSNYSFLTENASTARLQLTSQNLGSEFAQEPSGQHVSVRPLMRAARPCGEVHGSAGSGGRSGAAQP